MNWKVLIVALAACCACCASAAEFDDNSRIGDSFRSFWNESDNETGPQIQQGSTRVSDSIRNFYNGSIVGKEFELPPIEREGVMVISYEGYNITIHGIVDVSRLSIEGDGCVPINVTWLEVAGAS